METQDLPRISFNQTLVWDRCAFLWRLKYRDKWEKLDRKGRFRLELGNMGHAMLFDFYRTGQDHSEEFAKVWLEDVANLDGEQINNIAIAVGMFKRYREEFSPVEDRRLTTMTLADGSPALEYHFEVELETPQGRRFILEGYIDRISQDERGYVWIEDYKWTSRFWTNIEVIMDPQLPLYCGALRALGWNVHGLMVTQVNTYPYKGDTRSTKPIEEMVKRERTTVSVEHSAAVIYEFGRAIDEIAENEGRFRRSLRRDCKSCEMQEPCLLGLKGIDPIGFMAMSPDYRPTPPRPVERQDGVAVPLQIRARIPDITVDGDVINLNI